MARRVRLDGMVARLRAEGKDGLELLGSTLDALALHERDAAELRRRALAPLGLRPIAEGRALAVGEAVAVVEEDGVVLEGEVEAEAAAWATEVVVSLFGQPGVPLPRESLAEWSGGRADDFSADDWSWMGAAAAPEVAPARRPAKKKRR